MEGRELKVIQLGVQCKLTCQYQEFWYTKEWTYSSGPCPEGYYADVCHDRLVPIDIYFKLLIDRPDGFRVWIYSNKDLDQYTTFNQIYDNCGIFIDRRDHYYVSSDNYGHEEFYRSVVAATEDGTTETNPVRFGFGLANEIGSRINSRLRRIVAVDDSKYVMKWGQRSFVRTGNQPFDAKSLKIPKKSFNDLDPIATWNAYIDYQLNKVQKAKERAAKRAHKIEDIAWEAILLCTLTYNKTVSPNLRLYREKVCACSRKEAYIYVNGVYVKYNVDSKAIMITFGDKTKVFVGTCLNDENVSEFLIPLVKVAGMM